MNLEQMLTGIQALQDQEMEKAKLWMRESSDADLCALWLHINSDSKNVLEDITFRLASLGFAEAFIRMYDAEKANAGGNG